MKVPFYTSVREYHKRKEEFDNAIFDVLERGDFILGKDVAEFEKEAAKYLNVKYAIGVASGSDALVIGSDILGFKDGAEVLTPTFTFFASTSCVAHLKGKPVLVDIDEETLNMNLNQAEEKITKNTKGIIPVHLFLQPTPMQKVMDIGPVVARSIYDWFREKKNLEFLEKIKKVGVEVFEEKKPKRQPLRGKTFVLTGALETMSREEAKEKIRLLGGEISESVSKKTDYVVVGKEPGSKLERAKKLGVKTINEPEFLKLIR